MKEYIILARNNNGNEVYTKVLELFLDKTIKELNFKYDYIYVYECKFITSYYNNNRTNI